MATGDNPLLTSTSYEYYLQSFIFQTPNSTLQTHALSLSTRDRSKKRKHRASHGRQTSVGREQRGDESRERHAARRAD